VISIKNIYKVLGIKVDARNTNEKIIYEAGAFILAFETFCEEHLGIDAKDLIQAWYGYDERYLNRIERIKESLDTYHIELGTQLKNTWLEKVFINGWENRLDPYLRINKQQCE
jgi:hypothetical protein